MSPMAEPNQPVNKPDQIPDGSAAATTAAADVTTLRPKRQRRVGATVLAQGEQMLWLTSGGLMICLVMIIGLLSLILYQGTQTFWPSRVVQLKTLSGNAYMGEFAGESQFEIKFAELQMQGEAEQQALGELLNPQLLKSVQQFLSEDAASQTTGTFAAARRAAIEKLKLISAVTEAAPRPRAAFLDAVVSLLDSRSEPLLKRLNSELQQAAATDASGNEAFALWKSYRSAAEPIQYSSDLPSLEASLTADDSVLFILLADSLLTQLSQEATVPMHRRLIRTGNYELTNEHFNWVSDFEVVADGESYPEWALVFERIEKGRFYGIPKAIKVDGAVETDEIAEVWRTFQKFHAEVRARYYEAEDLSKRVQGDVNRRQEMARLTLREVELESGIDSDEWREASRKLEQKMKGLDAESAEVRQQIEERRNLNARYTLVVNTADGVEAELALADIVRVYQANHLTTGERLGVYLSRWGEFLFDDPREANSEGGVFPAIFGTIAMTLLMGIAVVPFGVCAALYLREYAKAGTLVSMIRIAINNLAGVPSIVFGVFGLGFFCYAIGSYIDGGPASIGVTPWPAAQWFVLFAAVAIGGTCAFFVSLTAMSGSSVTRTGWKRHASWMGGILWIASLGLLLLLLTTTPFFDGFYRVRLPSPTFGTGGLMWASMTLSLLTLPVVIVATEEALSAVPRSMREGSLACGATKWQTIQRIVLPRALPGIMTGMILAMARGAGEVAPLMLVGAMKLAPHLPIDLHDWSGDLGFLPTGPVHAERSFMHLGFHIFDLGFQSPNSEAAKPMVFTTTLLLIALIASMNLIAIWMRARLRKKFQSNQF